MRPTLYDAFARGQKWVLCRGFLCRIAAVPAVPGCFWLTHLGNRRIKGSQFHGFVPMTEPCTPIRPNTGLFLLNRRT